MKLLSKKSLKRIAVERAKPALRGKRGAARMSCCGHIACCGHVSCCGH